jgi:hypothetical protein
MIKRFLDQAKEAGELRDQTNTEEAADMIFSGMLGASVLFGMDKSHKNLDLTINSLIKYVESLSA